MKKCGERWIHFLDRFTIKNKLLVTLIPVIILIFLVLLATVYFISFRETQRIVNDQANIGMEQKVKLLDNYLSQLRMETEIFMFDSDVQKRMQIRKSSLSSADLEELSVEFRRDMYNIIINYDVNVEAITMHTVNNDFYYWKMDNRVPHYEFSSRLVRLEKRARSKKGDPLYSYEKLEKGIVTLSRLILDPVRDTELGTLMVDFNLGFLNGMNWTGSDPDVAPALIVTSADDQVIFNSSPISNDRIPQLQGENKMLLDGSIYRISHKNSKVSDWKAMLVINETELYDNIYKLTFFQVTLIIFTVGLIIVIIYQVSGAISGQFKHFMDTINQTTNPQDQALITVTSNDEFKDLAKVYNDMILRIDTLIDEVYAKELLLKNAELKSFQAQINPHFLYNTLDCINGLVDLNRPEDIKKTVAALANIMRMTIKGSEILTVRENMKYISEYMYIQKIRYGEHILFLTEIPEAMMEEMIPKLILQPLIENSIIHGISDNLGQGMIGVFGEEQETSISFTVKDNGKCIPEKIIEDLLNADDSPMNTKIYQSESIGLLNIQSRIRLMYGNDYGIKIQNLPGGGSAITIKLPKVKQEKLTEGERKDKYENTGSR